jgi:hypothetical protein
MAIKASGARRSAGIRPETIETKKPVRETRRKRSHAILAPDTGRRISVVPLEFEGDVTCPGPQFSEFQSRLP